MKIKIHKALFPILVGLHIGLRFVFGGAEMNSFDMEEANFHSEIECLLSVQQNSLNTIDGSEAIAGNLELLAYRP